MQYPNSRGVTDLRWKIYLSIVTYPGVFKDMSMCKINPSIIITNLCIHNIAAMNKYVICNIKKDRHD